MAAQWNKKSSIEFYCYRRMEENSNAIAIFIASSVHLSVEIKVNGLDGPLWDYSNQVLNILDRIIGAGSLHQTE